MTLSLEKNLRTVKVSVDPGNYAQGFRLFDSSTCPNYVNVDQYGRGGISVNSGYPQLNTSLGLHGICYSPMYLIQNENAVSRPQYSTYLNVPEGLQLTQNEYWNSAGKQDLLGVSRDRAFGLDGIYAIPNYPKSSNPSSDRDWNASENWYDYKTNQKYARQMFINSAEAGY
jgi:hypothetical protein